MSCMNRNLGYGFCVSSRGSKQTPSQNNAGPSCQGSPGAQKFDWRRRVSRPSIFERCIAINRDTEQQGGPFECVLRTSEAAGNVSYLLRV